MESISRSGRARWPTAAATTFDLEAAAAKEWNTVEGWRIVDETMQIRSGRGYETEAVPGARAESEPIGVERIMRDSLVLT